MKDAIDIEVDQLCGECWDHMQEEYDYRHEDPIGAFRAILSALVFTVLCGALLFLGGIIVAAFQ